MPTSDAVPQPPRSYAVFLSYRHDDNKQTGRQWASWLHHALETYEIPPDLVGTKNQRGERIPASLYPVFRDEEELPADADLGLNLRTALDRSRLLVVLCSPRAAGSRFVAEEIRVFKELGRADRILAFMIDGEPNAGDDPAKQRAGLAPELECLPEPLRFGRPRPESAEGAGAIDWTQRTEPIAADARPGGRPEQGWTTAAAYRETLPPHLPRAERDREVQAYDERLRLAVLKIVAGAISVPLGVLTQRDQAQQLLRARRRARLARTVAAVFLTLAFLAAGAAVLALQARREAERQRVAAEQQRQVARENETRATALNQEAARLDEARAQYFREQEDPRQSIAYLARAAGYDPSQARRYAAQAALDLQAAKLDRPLGPVELAGHAAGEPGSGFNGDVNQAAFSPDGRFVVTAGDDKTARIWEAVSGRPLAVLTGHAKAVICAAFSPDGQRVLTGSTDHTACLWESLSGRLLARLSGHNAAVSHASFSPDGTAILTAARDGTARLWDSATGGLVHIFDCGAQDTTVRVNSRATGLFTSFAPDPNALWSSDGRLIVTCGQNNEVRIWDRNANALVAALPSTDGLATASFSPDGRRLAVAAWDKSLRIFEADTGRLLKSAAYGEALMSVAFSPDGERIATTALDFSAQVWERETCALLTTMRGHTDFVLGVAFSPDGQRILTRARDTTARIWETETGTQLAAFEGHAFETLCAAFSPDGTRVASTSQRGIARLWESGSGRLATKLAGHRNTLQSKFSADGGRVLTTSKDNVAAFIESEKSQSARVWECESGRLLATKTCPGQFGELCFTKDGRQVIAQIDGHEVQVWDASTGQTLKLVPGTAGGLAVSPDSATFVTQSSDGMYAIYQTATGRLQTACEGLAGDRMQAPRFSPDGKRIAATSWDRGGVVWDSATGKVIARLANASGSVNFSPDGRRLASVSSELTVSIWETESGRPLVTLSPAESVVFSPDGTRVATSNLGKLVRVWESGTGKLVVAQGMPDQFSMSAFTPDGQSLLATGHHGLFQAACLWDTMAVGLLGAVGLRDVNFQSCLSPNGHRLLISRVGGEPLLFELLKARSRPPDWWVHFISLANGYFLDRQGTLSPIPAEQSSAWRSEVTPKAAADPSEYGEFARWILTPPEQRAVRPGSKLTLYGAAEALFEPGAEEASIRRAASMAPAHPLTQLALARFEKNAKVAEFLRDYTRQRLPAIPAVQARAAVLFLEQQQWPAALELGRKAAAAEPQNAFAQRAVARSSNDAEEIKKAFGVLLSLPEATEADYDTAEYGAAFRHDEPEARDIIRRGQARFPASADLRRGDGWTLLTLGAPAEAVDVLHLSERLLPPDEKPDLSLLGALAIANWQASQTAEAVKEYQRLIALRPDMARASAVLKLNWREGDRNTLVQILEETLRFHPELAAPGQ